jgi:Protein of unknown function (DUF3455)
MSLRLTLLTLLVSFALLSQTAQNPLANSAMKDPDGQKVQFRFQTLPNSVQIYTCKQAGQSFAWSGPDPDAVMVDSVHKLTVHHYKGPTWEATDGSIVHSEGPLAKHYLATDSTAVHWLELPAKDASKQFAEVTFIHRIDTSGGLPSSAKPCDAQHAGDQERVPYSATYLFYAAK